MFKKMLIIGKCREVFRNKVSDLLTAKSFKEFTLAKDNIEQRHVRYLKIGWHQITHQNPY
jgi:hypothetical protein